MPNSPGSKYDRRGRGAYVKRGRAAERTDTASAEMASRGADYTAAELEFMAAVVRYQKKTGRKFLSHTDYLRVLLALGYARPAAG